MAIRIAPKGGLAGLYGRMATLAGQAIRARQQELEAQRMARQMLQLQERRELEQQEQQFRLELFKQSQAWQIEKMRIASLNDFMQQEKELQAERDQIFQKRLLEKEQLYATIKAIQDADHLSPAEKNEAIFRAQLKFLGYQDILPRPRAERQQDIFTQLAEQAITQQPTSISTAPAAGTTATPQLQTTQSQYTLGQIIERGGKQYKVVGFDTDGMPLVNEL